MKINSSFNVSLPLAEAWTVLMDIERIAPCMPGAEITEIPATPRRVLEAIFAAQGEPARKGAAS